MKLLYRVAEWHGFAKMWMHTDSTLKHLNDLTTELGKLVRDFETSTCSQFTTFELPRETEARKRRTQGQAQTSAASESTAGGKRARSLNLFTYKWHSLGDYVLSIRLFGGTDGISTQIVSPSPDIVSVLLMFFQGELAHRLVKRLYKLTNKHDPAKQIGKQVRRLEMAQQAFHRRKLREKQHVVHSLSKAPKSSPSESDAADDSDLRYFISPSLNERKDIWGLIKSNSGDPAYKV